MSNNFNQNDNTRYQRSNYKNNKQPRVNPNEIKAPLSLSLASLDENIVNEIFDILDTTKFNKISIPLNTYRYLIDTECDKNDDRVFTIGYIRDYDKEAKIFTVVLFGKFIELFKSYEKTVIEIQCIESKGHLRTITKFNIVPVEE